MTTSRFARHGEFEARIEGRVLIATVSGAWNIEQHAYSQLQSAPLVERLESTGEPWGCLVVVEDTLVSCLSVLEQGRDALARSPARHLKALAWAIAPEVEGYRLLIERYRRLYEGLLDTAVFPSADEGLQCLRDRLVLEYGVDGFARSSATALDPWLAAPRVGPPAH